MKLPKKISSVPWHNSWGTSLTSSATPGLLKETQWMATLAGRGEVGSWGLFALRITVQEQKKIHQLHSCRVIFHCKDVVAWLAQQSTTHSWTLTWTTIFDPKVYQVDVRESDAENTPQLLPAKWLSICCAVLKTSSATDIHKEIPRRLQWFLGCMGKPRIIKTLTPESNLEIGWRKGESHGAK